MATATSGTEVSLSPEEERYLADLPGRERKRAAQELADCDAERLWEFLCYLRQPAALAAIRESGAAAAGSVYAEPRFPVTLRQRPVRK